MDIAIKISNLYKSFGDNQVLKDVSLEIKKGESFVLIGGSGTGKSVLMKNIMGIITPDSGNIYINGDDTTYISQASRIKLSHKIGMLFQGSALFDSLSVLDNVVFFESVRGKLTSKRAKEIALDTIELVGLKEEVLSKFPAELSGGMQKRVALARLLVQKPEILFFDEPTTGLDPVMSDIINNLIIKTTQYLGATSFTITHDMKSAKKIANKIAMIDDGRIVWQGIPQEIDESDNKILYNFIRGISS